LEDALQGEPELLLEARPKALRDDPVYGPPWRRLVETALARGRATSRFLEAVHRSDAVVVGLAHLRRNDALFAMRGVPAEFDPVGMVDTDGQTLWREATSWGTFAEYPSVDPTSSAVLFVLPRRQWVIATGRWVAEARTAFLHPRGPRAGESWGLLPSEDTADVWLGMALQGDALRREWGPLRHGALAPLGHGLGRATLFFSRGEDHALRVRLFYPNERDVPPAATNLRELLQAVARSETLGPRWGWLRDTTLTTQGTDLDARVPVPSVLFDKLDVWGGAVVPEASETSSPKDGLGPNR
jgi:hypothetical protein